MVNHRFLNIAGVVIVLSLSAFLLVWGMSYLKDAGGPSTLTHYDVLFKQVGSLTKGDPVKVNGFKVGRVSEMKLDTVHQRVRVTVEIRGDFGIPTHSQFRLQNIGMLGERQVGIFLGDNIGDNIQPNSQVEGIYDDGVAEAMAKAGEVFDSAQILLRTVRGSVDSTIGTPQFKQDFHSIVGNTLKLQKHADSILNRLDPALRKSLNNLQLASTRVNQLLEQNKEPLRQTVDNAQKLTIESRALVSRADSLTARLNRISSKLESSDNTAGALLQDRKIYDDLRSTLKSTDSLMQTVIRSGLDVNVDLF